MERNDTPIIALLIYIVAMLLRAIGIIDGSWWMIATSILWVPIVLVIGINVFIILFAIISMAIASIVIIIDRVVEKIIR